MKKMANYVGNVDFLYAERGVEVFRLEGDRETPDEERDPHKHAYQEFIWVTEGGGKHIIDGETYAIEPNTFFIVKKWQVHKVVLDRDAKGMVVLFDDDLMFSGSSGFGQFKYFLTNPTPKGNVLKVEENELPFYKASMQQMFELYNSDINWGKCLLMRNLVESILIKSMHLMSQQNGLELMNSNSIEEVSSFFILLEKFYKQQHEVNFYADEMRTSVRRLNSLLKENFGKTIRDMLNDRVIAEAKRLLTYSNMTVKEIAHELGFHDPSYFTRLFRQKSNETPVEYRKSLKKLFG